LGLLYNTQGRYADGLSYIRRSTGILRRRGMEGAGSKSIGAESERKGNRYNFEWHSLLAFKVSERDLSQAVALHEEAFEIIQLAQRSSASSALSQMSARLGAGDKALATAVRRRQDIIVSWRSLDKELIDELSKPKDERSPERETQLRAEIGKTDTRLNAVDKELAEKFPKYIELSNPQPLKVSAVQSLLGNDEALVVYNASYAWVVQRDGFRMVKLDIGAKELEAAVSKLRASFTQVQGKLPAFPYDVAHDLYERIFAPLESDLAGARHVMVVPSGPLTSLPLAVLVSSAHEGKGKPSWLVQKYAFTTLPSVSSLRSLRVLASNDTVGLDPFTGFGDPVLNGDPSDRRGISIVPLFSGGQEADGDALRRLAALPDTADELRAIARSLGASNDNVYLGEKATEGKVKSLDLSNTKVLAFATHGLVAGELRGYAEPGLVLSPPSVSSSTDDGVLTASEVAQLKLYPGLVILSACNTAAADGKPGAEGLSGLAKAFFYAGSQSLLVSHWAMETNAAKRLTTGMFEELKRDPGMGRSEALRRSMMVLAANDNTSHPAYWAPFSLVGEDAGAR
jgi:CHAT domain-containing protein